MVFQIPSVQTYAAKRSARYLSKELGTPISIKKVEIDFWNKIYLEAFYLEDLHQDTLLALENVELGIGFFDWSEKKITCDLTLNNGYINIHKAEGESEFNHQFILDYLESDSLQDEKPLEWKVKVENVSINNSQLKFNNNTIEKEAYGLDINHITLNEFNLTAEEVNIEGDTVVGQINRLSFREENGFELSDLRAEVSVTNGGIELADLIVKTTGTNLQGDFSFKGNDFQSYQSFYDKVNMKARIRKSTVDLNDLAYFAPKLKGIADRVYIDGEAKGTVDNLQTEHLELRLNSTTKLIGDLSMRGLPNIENTFIFFDLEELTTDANGIRNMPLPPFSEGKTVDLPAYFDRLGNIKFKGNFTGYLTDFVAYGQFKTALGNVQTDLLLKDQGENQLQYSGNIATTDFNLGEFFHVPDLEKVDFDLALVGSGTTLENLNAKVSGKVNTIVFKQFDYENVVLNGTFKKETFTGDFIINNESLDLTFNGEIDVNSKSPVSNFNLNVNRAKLATLNLFNHQDSTTEISFNSSVDIIGFDIDQFKGIASIRDLKYKDARQKHQVESIQLRANYDNEKRFIELKSNVLDAYLEGNFKLREMKDIYYAYLTHYFPNETNTYKAYEPQDIRLIANIKDATPYTEVFLPELSIQPNTTLKAALATQNYFLDLSLTSNQIVYKDITVNDIKTKVQGDSNSLDFEFNSTAANFGENKSLEGIQVNSNLINSINSGKITWNKYGKTVGKTKLTFNQTIESLHKMEFNLFDSYITVNDSLWSISNQSLIELDTSILTVSQLSIGNGYQNLYLNGTASKSVEDTMNVQLNNIDLEFVSSLLPEGAVNLKGTANGSADLLGVYGELSLTTGLELKELFINNIEVGNSTVSSVWMPQQEALIIDGNLGEKGSDILTIDGVVYPLKEENSLDLNLKFNHFPLPLIKPYLKGYLSEIEGSLHGNLKVLGEGNTPLISGMLDLDSAGFQFDYLNTHYTIDDKIVIEPDFIGFNLMKVYDSKGSPAITTGTIFHENYTNFNFDIGLEFEKFLALNTTAKDNSLYYGKAITSGVANISGYGNQLIIELDIKSEKDTEFKIPLTEGVDISNSSFLIFTNSPDFNQRKTDEVDLSGIQMNFDLEITPEANIQIIFDEQVGDLINAKGQGDLKLEINTIGDFNMFGQYTVVEGDYLFTLQSVVNKRFDLASGSRISWDGDPYQATLDMQAIYKLRSPLVNLFPDDTTSGFKRRIPIELELQLSEKLLSPNISFDIRLPTADENTKQQLESVLYVNSNEVNPQEMNQQVFGLLVLNRFLPSASSSSTTQSQSRGTPGINNGYEFVSNQLSNWFSKVSDQFDVGVKYRPGDELNADELDLSLSTEILNDRLVLDGNFGFSGDSPEIENPNSGFIGEFTAEYKISADGRYRVIGFNRSVSNSLLQFNSPYTQGFGLFYREEFDNVGELWKKYFGKKEK